MRHHDTQALSPHIPASPLSDREKLPRSETMYELLGLNLLRLLSQNAIAEFHTVRRRRGRCCLRASSLWSLAYSHSNAALAGARAVGACAPPGQPLYSPLGHTRAGVEER